MDPTGGHFTVCGAVGHSAVTFSFDRMIRKHSFVDVPGTVHRGLIDTCDRMTSLAHAGGSVTGRARVVR